MQVPILARLAGRCANGAERDGGRKVHVVMADSPFLPSPCYGPALCGVKPGRLSNGWVDVDGPEVPTCPRCAARADRLMEKRG